MRLGEEEKKPQKHTNSSAGPRHAHSNLSVFTISLEKALVLQPSSSRPSASREGWSSPPDDANTAAGRDLVCPNVLGVRRSGFFGREQARPLVVITEVLLFASLVDRGFMRPRFL